MIKWIADILFWIKSIFKSKPLRLITSPIYVPNKNPTLLTSTVVREKLLLYGMFSEKLENIFSSYEFGQWILLERYSQYSDQEFSAINFKLTRNNNVPRLLHIPHPIAYARLSNDLADNWGRIWARIQEVPNYSAVSRVIPRENNENNRLISLLAYNRLPDDELIKVERQKGAKYFVYADISDCFRSIYSHAIGWAAVGHENAKFKQLDKTEWYNILDFNTRSMQRNETMGVQIGPDTSNIIAELILSRVDVALQGYNYLRYVDDYQCFVSSRDEADNFINDLGRELEKFHLRLNAKKTRVGNLPIPINPKWITQLRTYSKVFASSEKLGNKDIPNITRLIDTAIDINTEFPNESALKYVASTLSSKIYESDKCLQYTADYLFRICLVHPYLVSTIEKLLLKNKSRVDLLTNWLSVELPIIIEDAIKFRRSDAITHSINIAITHKVMLNDINNYFEKLCIDDDCIPATLCYSYARSNGLVLKPFYKYVEEIIKQKKEDEWWIYVYEIFRDNENKQPFRQIQWKDYYIKMKDNGITFIK